MKSLLRESGVSGSKRRGQGGKGGKKINRLSIAARSSVYAGLMPMSDERSSSQRRHQSITARGSLHIEDGVKITQAGIVIRELSQMSVANVHQIDAKFELIPLVRLGAGASGTVYSAVHIPSLRLVAVKQVPYHDKDQRKQLVQEIRSLQKNHVQCNASAFRCSAHPETLPLAEK